MLVSCAASQVIRADGRKAGREVGSSSHTSGRGGLIVERIGLVTVGFAIVGTGCLCTAFLGRNDAVGI
jgi:hypothetical protein